MTVWDSPPETMDITQYVSWSETLASKGLNPFVEWKGHSIILNISIPFLDSVATQLDAFRLWLAQLK